MTSKRHFLKTALLLTLALAGTTAAHAADGLYTLKCGERTMTVDAAHGGKILSLKYGDTEVLSQSRFPESFGSTFWTSPQKEWNWPPVAEFDKQAYTVEQAEPGTDATATTLLRIRSQVSARLGFSIGKTFRADAKSGTFTITYTIKNEGSEARRVAPWEISRVPNGESTIFFQAENDKVWPDGLLSFQPAQKAVWYKPDEAPQNRKVNADGKGWLAYCANNLLLLKTFPDMKAGEEAPGEAEIQVYVNRGKTYIELESQGAYTLLQPGQELSWTVGWHLLPVNEKTQAPKKLIKKVLKIKKAQK